MWGILPAAGAGSRIQPLAFSKELLPVGSRIDDGSERPRAVSEYLVDRMIAAGATKLCFVVGRSKLDILEYFGGADLDAITAFVVQPAPRGLCDALFRAVPLIGQDEPVVVGLPDTIWFPENALCTLPEDVLSFLLFPVEHPERFDAVVTAPDGRVLEIQVKSPTPATSWIWGAFKAPGRVFHELFALWKTRGGRDEYLGTLVNAWLAEGGSACAVRAGSAYVDVGTLHGYREALRLLAEAHGNTQ